MAVSEQTTVNSSTGNGVTTVFPYTFKILAAADLEVTVDGVVKALNTDYTVSGVGSDAGNVTFTTAPANGTTVTRRRNMPYARTTDYQYQGDLPTQTLNDDQDAPILMIQQLSEILGRVPQWPVGDAGGSELPSPDGNEGMFLGIDGDQNWAFFSGTGGADSALRTDLAAATGSALVGFQQAGTGAVALSVQSFLRGLFITPAQYGAVGDGVTDDTQAWEDVLVAAAGRPIVGDPTKIYTVTGDLMLPVITRIRDCHFKQLDPDDTSRRTLHMTTGTYCELVNVKVDRNGDGNGGAIATAAGIWIEDCDRLLMVDCEVTGADKGNGIVISACNAFRLVRPYVHDIRAGDASHAVLTDDAVQGIWVMAGLRGVIEAPNVYNLTTQWSGQAEWTRFTRGIAVSSAGDLQIITPTVDSVDQGIDLTGDLNPDRIVVLGGVVSNCRTYGGKCANTVTFSRWIGVTARFCGLAGFIASGWSGGALQTSDIVFDSCLSIGTGSNGYWAASNVSGFMILNGGGAFTTYPRGVRFVNCLADGVAGTMKYGFYSDLAGYPGNDQWNEVVDCKVRNHTVAKFGGTATGFQQAVCQRQRSTTQSIPNNAFTAADFNVNLLDRMNGSSGTGTQIVITKPGVYQVSGMAAFAANGTGVRKMRLVKNGVGISGGQSSMVAHASGAMQFGVSVPTSCDTGDLITMELFQDSGAGLNTSAGDVILSVVMASSDRGTT